MTMKRGMLMIGALVAAFAATADTYYWRATGDSTNWNTTETNWAATSDSGATKIAFVTGSDANFDGGDSATTVTVDADGVSVASLNLNASDKTYTFDGGSLSMSGWVRIYNGTFKLGTLSGFSDWIEVNGGGEYNYTGTFDFYCTEEWKKRLEGKNVYLKGGTLKNSGTETVWFTPKQVVLEADSTVDGDAPISFYYLNNSNASITGANISGAGYVLSIATPGETYFTHAGSVSLKRLDVTGGGTIVEEGDNEWNLAEGIKFTKGGAMCFKYYNDATSQWTNDLTVAGGSVTISNTTGTTTFTETITVAEGATLVLGDSTIAFTGTIVNNGTIVLGSGNYTLPSRFYNHGTLKAADNNTATITQDTTYYKAYADGVVVSRKKNLWDSAVTGEDWKTRTDWDSDFANVTTNAMSIASEYGEYNVTENAFPYCALTSYSGWFSNETASAWSFISRAKNNYVLYIDGNEQAFTINNEVGTSSAIELSAGWHSFEFRIWHYNGTTMVSPDATALSAKINDGEEFAFDETKVTFASTDPAEQKRVGKLNGNVVVESGATIQNGDANTAIKIVGTLSGSGTMDGKFQFDGGALGVTTAAKTVTSVPVFTNADDATFAGLSTIAVTATEKPTTQYYTLADALGFVSAGVTCTLDGAEFTAQAKDGKLVLLNCHAPGLIIVFR